MSKSNPNQPRKNHKKVIITISIIGVILFILFGWWLYGVTRSYPLGDKVEYVGKEDYGCYISLTICDSNPTSTYYYATDMSIEDIAKYLNSTIERKPSTIDNKIYFGIKTPSGETIYTYYYPTKDVITKKYKLHTSAKAHILEMPSFKYNLAKNSLK